MTRTLFADSRQKRFEHVVRAYASDVFRFLYWLSRDRGVAEDLAQETFARAWASWEELRDEKAVKAWLFTIARNEHARLHERKALDIDPDAELEVIMAPQASDPGLAIDLRKAIGLLSPAYREPLLLQVLAGLTSAEIALSLEVTEEAVNMRLSRARRALRDLLEPPDTETQRSGSRA